MVYGRPSRKRRYKRRVLRTRGKRRRVPRRRNRRVARVLPTRKAARSNVVTLRNILTPTKNVLHDYRSFTIEGGTSVMITTLAFSFPAATIFQLNSLYDPCTASSGTNNVSTALYLYMSKLYGHYLVKRAVVTYEFVQRNVNAGTGNFPYPCVIGVALQSNGSAIPYTSWTSMEQDPRIKCRTVYVATAATQPKARCRIRLVYDEKKYFRSSGDDEHGADIGANPADPVFSVPYIIAKDSGYAAINYPNFYVKTYVKCYAVWTKPVSIISMPADAEMVQIVN